MAAVSASLHTVEWLNMSHFGQHCVGKKAKVSIHLSPSKTAPSDSIISAATVVPLPSFCV
jgi:hypothetical protein